MTNIILEQPPHTVEYFCIQKDHKPVKAVVVGHPKTAVFANVAKGFREVADWTKTANSKHFPNGQYPDCAQTARVMVERFIFPQDLRNQAHFLSRELTGALDIEGGPKTIHKQSYGRFDPKSMNRVIRDLNSGKYSRDHTKPYYTRERVAPKPPHVAIVADGSAASMWSSEDYIPRVATMMLGVTWACEALNCEVTTALTENSSVSSDQDMDLLVNVVNDADTKTPLNTLGVFFHRDLYRASALTVFASHVESIKLFNKGVTDPRRMTPGGIASRGGGLGYSWAKSRGADIIIAIGSMNIIHDKDPIKAEKEKRSLIQIDSRTDLKDAIRKIADELIKIKYQRAA